MFASDRSDSKTLEFFLEISYTNEPIPINLDLQCSKEFFRWP